MVQLSHPCMTTVKITALAGFLVAKSRSEPRSVSKAALFWGTTLLLPFFLKMHYKCVCSTTLELLGYNVLSCSVSASSAIVKALGTQQIPAKRFIESY